MLGYQKDQTKTIKKKKNLKGNIERDFSPIFQKNIMTNDSSVLIVSYLYIKTNVWIYFDRLKIPKSWTRIRNQI